MKIADVINAQHEFFRFNHTKDTDFRIRQLKKLKQLISDNETTLYQAIFNDFGKSEFETYLAELSPIYHEIDLALKNIQKWSKRQRVRTDLANFPAKSYLVPEPLGSVLVIGAWNYPYHLSLIPAISALAAGNTVIIKPSELPSRTSSAMAKLINESFSADYLHIIEGGVEETTELLKYRFDKIFFTGSTAVGKIVYQAAAEHLTPVTLELGGKSPTFVFADCDLPMTAKRIVWAKFLNAGQTCVAPDYILVEKSIKDAFLQAVQHALQHYPQTPETEIDPLTGRYVQIINQHHFQRLNSLIETAQDKVHFGGNRDTDSRFISPTILQDITFNDEIMQEEIFGPILPVIAFNDLDEVIQTIKQKPRPLSCYIYSKNQKLIDKILNEISFGGGCVNDSLMHLTNGNLPFGGVGMSGFGCYHGKAGFDTFTHYKSILHKPFLSEPSLKHPPYSKWKLNLLKWFLK
ncbi:aldehyde dehydrogenase [Thiomicrorhabdus sp.]|uniref:aldehyde dehydrogenase n=1 Tax=Thiomicrorhabdus sp. TaxID=2039724 RepID=UPI0029C7EA80|nr:aldehyde dehydrogenase [Thiomicrorhabdus sp.]